MAKSAAAKYTTSTTVRGYVKAELHFRRLKALAEKKREQQRPAREKLERHLRELDSLMDPLRTKIQRAHEQVRVRLLKLKGPQMAVADRILDQIERRRQAELDRG